MSESSFRMIANSKERANPDHYGAFDEQTGARTLPQLRRGGVDQHYWFNAH